MKKNIAEQLRMDRSRCIELCDMLKRVTRNKISIGEVVDIAIEYCSNENEKRFVYYILGTLVGVSIEHENQLKYIDNLMDEISKSEEGMFISSEDFNPSLN